MTAPYPAAIPTTSDPTEVMGRRIGAYIIDVIPALLAMIVGFIIFFSAGTRLVGVGSDFCDRVNRDTFRFDEDALVEQYDTGYTCVQLNDEAVVVANEDTRRAFSVGFLIWLLVPLNYFLLQGTTGASVGKHLFGLRVVRDDGEIAGFGRNAGRTAMLVVDAGFCSPLVGLITALVTRPHRRVGDMAAGTYVIAKDRVGAPVTASIVPTAPTWQAPPATWTPYQSSTPPATTAPTSTGAPTWGATPPSSVPDDRDPDTTVGIGSPGEPDARGPHTGPHAGPHTGPHTGPGTPPMPSPANLPPGAEMRWDERWNAWLYWDPAARRWLRHDRTTNQWVPM